jgi:hypothetical protein
VSIPHPDDEIVEHWEDGHTLVRRPDGMLEVRWAEGIDERQRIERLEIRLTSALNALRHMSRLGARVEETRRSVVAVTGPSTEQLIALQNRLNELADEGAVGLLSKMDVALLSWAVGYSTGGMELRRYGQDAVETEQEVKP